MVVISTAPTARNTGQSTGWNQMLTREACYEHGGERMKIVRRKEIP